MDAARNSAVREYASAHGAEPVRVRRTSEAANFTRYQPLVIVTLASAAGIIFDRYGPQRPLTSGDRSVGDCFWFYVWWCGAALFVAAWRIAKQRERDGIAGWLVLMAAALAGAAWHQLNWFLYDAHEIGRYAVFEPGPVCIEAIAQQSPERVSAPTPNPMRAIPQGEKSRLLVDVTRIRDGSDWRPASGVCQLAIEGHVLGVHAGDRLRVFGQVSRIAPPLNPGEFDFAEHARADRQLVRVRSSLPESVTILDHGSAWTLANMLDVVRSRAKQSVRSLVGVNRAGLAAAILLGAREGLPYEETESYLVTGTIHVLAV